MIEEQYVSIATAKLAKEKGFTGRCYGNDGQYYSFNVDNIGDEDLGIAAPTQSLLARWLREKRYIFLSIDIKPNLGFVYGIKCFDRDFLGHTNFSQFSYATYEEAMEAGLQEALKLI